ncbi:uncharacterized protein V6R79_005385 [Siganus canaliculatus]
MDDTAASTASAATREEEADKQPFAEALASEIIVDAPAEDTTGGVGLFCCEDCGEAFREEAAYLEHRHQHLQESVYLDNHNDGLNNAKKDSQMDYFCAFCSLSFDEATMFHSHMEEIHGQASQKVSSIHMRAGVTKQHTYECPECGKCYGVIGHFLNHQRSHRQASKSLFHDLEHLKKKSFQCESCGRNYSRASALDAHRRCHEEKLVKSRNRGSGDACQAEEPAIEAKPSENQADDIPEKPFTCSCGKAFSALMRLKTHQRFSRNSQCSPEEMKEKPKKSCSEFYCSECKKSFSGHIALFNHQRWHINHSNDSAKRFPCEECGKVFMTLTFYYRHQRLVHSAETPAKSFLHQVCQLQKKAFECEVCGLKFSRASALHSHQLHHTDVFKETEKEAQVHTSPLPQLVALKSEAKETEQEHVETENLFPAAMVEDQHIHETDEDMESYEPGDFNVQVISASESEDEISQEVNPDLELLCESDQEVKDDDDVIIVPSSVMSKQQLDLKIVQIDFELAADECTVTTNDAQSERTEERFECLECYRWFTSASSLRAHRMWHGIRKKRQQTQGQSEAVYTHGDVNGSSAEHSSHILQHKDGNTSEVLDEAEGVEKNLTCSDCGKGFPRLSALVSHQLHHPKGKQFQCPDCMMSYSHATSLFNHMKNCSTQKKENISDAKKEYNPKKTLLGPKIYHCEQCGKGFWSLGAYAHHKQNQTLCTDLRLRKGVTGSLHSVNGHSRSSGKVACPVCGRKFRHKGIMALHMRKHENGNHKCELCNRSFRLFSSLLRHQVVHSDQLLPPPAKSFQHQVEQLKKNTYSCPDCSKLFSRAKALQFHMKSHGYETGYSPSSPKSTASLENLQCATCLAHFNSKASLKAHQKLCIKRDSQAFDSKTGSSDSNNLKLQVGLGVDSRGSSEQVMVNAQDNGIVSKGGSMGAQTSAGNLKTQNAPDLKYKCDKCDRSFSVVGALNFHKRIHSEGFKSVAKAKLAMSVTLKNKQVESSKERFHCSDCGRRFVSNSALGSHKRWHKEKKSSLSLLKEDNSKSVSNKAEGGPFQCQTCAKQFFNVRVLQRHLMYNPQCRIKMEPDSSKNMESSDELKAAHHTSEHSITLEVASHQGHEATAVDQIPEQLNVPFSGSGSTSATLKPKPHQCPLCHMSFAKVKGLRAHKWQAHSRKTENKSQKTKRFASLIKKEPIATSCEVTQPAESPENSTATGSGKRSLKSDPPSLRPVSCLDCGEQCNSPLGLLHHKKVCVEVNRESQQADQTPDIIADVSAPLSRLTEHTPKYLFKCAKCGKAFQTEEQLGTHKSRAKLRPHCCALCCSSFWTENQLQQHLVWHDEVRCRLPNELRYRLSAAMTSRSVKPNVPAADSGTKPFPASTLSRPTLSPDSQSLSSHKCQHCGKAFLSPAALQKHETQHCSSDSYHCSICPRTFSQIQDLVIHLQECISDNKNTE